jgi:type I restriction enzyme R subunit
MVEQTTPIAESKNFIVLDKYASDWPSADHYQSEAELERELIKDLRNQGYEFLPDLTSQEAMLANVRVQLEALNNVSFTGPEWQRFVLTYLDSPSDGIIDKTRKVHDDYIHDFVFDDGRIQNIYLFRKDNVARNKLQVIKQFEQTGLHANRYDVTILVNGLPLVQIEIKRRSAANLRSWLRLKILIWRQPSDTSQPPSSANSLVRMAMI